MKKAFLIICCLSLFSCAKRKDWECTCYVSGPTDEGVYKETFKWRTESKANEKCKVFGMKKAGDLNSYSCSIK